MNSHKNARLSFEGRRLLIQRIAVMGLAPAATRTRCSVDGAMSERIERLRRQRMPMRRIAQTVGRSTATISRWLASLGLSSLKALDPQVPVQRYEREAPGELLHIDTKKLGRIAVTGHRATGNPRTAHVGLAGSLPMWPSTTIHAQALCRC